MSVLVRPSGPTATLGLCDILPRTFGLNGFLPLSARENFSGDSSPHGAGGCIITLYFTSRTLRTMSVATRHTRHDRFIASRGAWLSQTMPPLFTELRTFHMTLWMHVGVSEFWSPVTPGQAGTSPAKSSIEFRFSRNLPCFIAYFYADCQGTKRARASRRRSDWWWSCCRCR